MDSACAASLLPELVRQYYALLYRYAFRLSGESARAADLTQQTFLTAQVRLVQLRDSGSARNWLCAILRNLFLKEQRRSALVKFQSLSSVADPLSERESDSPVDSEQLQAALMELTEEFRSPLILFYFEEFTYREIADHMQVPVGTVMSRLARAKALLRKRLGPGVIEPGEQSSAEDSGGDLRLADEVQTS